MSASTAIEDVAQQFIARWNKLVSTTNWEKGRIIHQWRQSLIESDAPEESYTDETWANRVGHVTPQHVGRLRRVWHRFGDEYENYPRLHWSHFQAAVNWDNAEMYLEGAVQNGWSVAQMRDRRWRDEGALAEDKPEPDDIVAAELDEDVDPGMETSGPAGESSSIRATDAEVRDTDDDNWPDDDPPFDVDDSARASADDQAEADYDEAAARQLVPVQPFKDLPSLPDDLDEAVEAMKLALIGHKSNDWRDISRDDALRVVEALRELILAPA